MLNAVKFFISKFSTGGLFWLKQSAIALDQFLNAFLFGGWADETMSSTLWRMEVQRKLAGILLRPVVDRLFWFDPDHCRSSFDSERLHNQSPSEVR